MKFLVYGAGVIGSIFGTKLANAGHDVTMLARGQRLRELEESGLILEDPNTGREERAVVQVVEELPAEAVYDYILVVMQRTQVDAVLDALARNASKNIVFVVNNAGGYEHWIRQIGMDRLMIGFPSAGGERVGGRVRYFVGKGLLRMFQTTTFGEASGRKTARVIRLIRAFSDAGIPAVYCSNMDAWQKTHVAFVSSIANALYEYDCDNKALAKCTGSITDMILSIKEGFKVLRAIGIKPTPLKMRMYDLPTTLLLAAFKIMMPTRLAEVTMAKHSAVAKTEMRFLQGQFDKLIAQSGVPTPAIDKLRSFCLEQKPT